MSELVNENKQREYVLRTLEMIFEKLGNIEITEESIVKCDFGNSVADEFDEYDFCEFRVQFKTPDGKYFSVYDKPEFIPENINKGYDNKLLHNIEITCMELEPNNNRIYILKEKRKPRNHTY